MAGSMGTSGTRALTQPVAWIAEFLLADSAVPKFEMHKDTQAMSICGTNIFSKFPNIELVIVKECSLSHGLPSLDFHP